MEKIKCYDTIAKQYIMVEVTEDIAQFMRRSYWKEDMQDRRFQKRKVLFDEHVDYLDSEDITLEELIKDLQKEIIRKEMLKLDERDRKILYYIYYQDLSLSKTANLIGVSTSYMSRLVAKIYNKLKMNLYDIS